MSRDGGQEGLTDQGKDFRFHSEWDEKSLGIFERSSGMICSLENLLLYTIYHLDSVRTHIA